MSQGDIGDSGGSFFAEVSTSAGANNMTLDLPHFNGNTGEDNCGIIITLQGKLSSNNGAIPRATFFAGTTGGFNNDGTMIAQDSRKSNGLVETSVLGQEEFLLTQPSVGSGGFSGYIFMATMKYAFKPACSITTFFRSEASSGSQQLTCAAGTVISSQVADLTFAQPSKVKFDLQFTGANIFFSSLIATSYGWGNGNKAS